VNVIVRSSDLVPFILAAQHVPAGAMHDVVVIGGGIVGLAVARAIERSHPGADVVVVEKESQVGRHQTGHNSGVVHSGLYYRPGSLKARLCVEGRHELLDFCEAEDIPVGRSGKVVVATQDDQVEALQELFERGTTNGLSGLERLGRRGIVEHEPHASGVAGIWVPETAVVDYGTVAVRLASQLRVETDFAVDTIATSGSGILVASGERALEARRLVNCAGLHSDRVAELAGVTTDLRIVPFRGEYFVLDDEAADLVRGMIYPVPDPRFPFLGVHFTRKVDGSVEVGPNAVLALAREHYRGSAPSPSDLFDTVTWPGFWKIVTKYWRTGTQEMWHSLRSRSYASLARELVPELGLSSLSVGGAGVRAQAVGRDGRLLDDFAIVESDNAVHVLNAPSPGATSSLAIGRFIAARVSL
jgi:L-2-hydroxyglutarate oxidase